jgi:hypothetical protein
LPNGHDNGVEILQTHLFKCPGIAHVGHQRLDQHVRDGVYRVLIPVHPENGVAHSLRLQRHGRAEGSEPRTANFPFPGFAMHRLLQV